MFIGYARTSTIEQAAGLEAQIRDLKAIGMNKIFSEQVSSIAKRDQLEAAMEFCRHGDTLVVTKLDRLARSTKHLLEIIDLLDEKKVGLRILDFGGGEVDSSSATGKLMLTMFGAFGEFERSMMLERQREGIAKAKADGKYKGRAPTARAKSAEVMELKSQGIGPTAIAKRLKISRGSVYRIIREAA